LVIFWNLLGSIKCGPHSHHQFPGKRVTPTYRTISCNEYIKNILCRIQKQQCYSSLWCPCAIIVHTVLYIVLWCVYVCVWILMDFYLWNIWSPVNIDVKETKKWKKKKILFPLLTFFFYPRYSNFAHKKTSERNFRIFFYLKYKFQNVFSKFELENFEKCIPNFF
jgi:hypothetical protein